MGITSQMLATVRGAARRLFSGLSAPQGVDINAGGDLIVSQGLPERAELVRLGKSWSAQIKEANAFTLLITIPTTRAELALQNPATSGVSYVIDRIWCKAVTSLAAANYLTLLAQVTPPGTAIVADSANKFVSSLSGKPAYNGAAQLAVASTATGALADKWVAMGTNPSLPTSTSIAAFVEDFCEGKYIIPPGGVFNLNAQEAVSGGTAILGVEWHEVVLDLG